MERDPAESDRLVAGELASPAAGGVWHPGDDVVQERAEVGSGSETLRSLIRVKVAGLVRD